MRGFLKKLLSRSKTLDALFGDVVFATPQEHGVCSPRSFFEWRVKSSVDNTRVYIAVKMSPDAYSLAPSLKAKNYINFDLEAAIRLRDDLNRCLEFVRRRHPSLSEGSLTAAWNVVANRGSLKQSSSVNLERTARWGFLKKLLSKSKPLNAAFGSVIFTTPQERGASSRSFFEWRVKSSLDDTRVYVGAKMTPDAYSGNEYQWKNYINFGLEAAVRLRDNLNDCIEFARRRHPSQSDGRAAGAT
jgi:hypothetical protein